MFVLRNLKQEISTEPNSFLRQPKQLVEFYNSFPAPEVRIINDFNSYIRVNAV